MALEVVHGETHKRGAAGELARTLKRMGTDGTLYLGYPILATADDRVEVDALLVSQEHGMVAFLLAEGPPGNADWEPLIDAQDRLYAVLESALRRHETLRRRRGLAVDIETVTVFPAKVEPPADAEGMYLELAEVPGWLNGLGGVESEVLWALNAALQRVATIKPAKKRADAVQAGSRGNIMKTIEKGIANLDQWQKSAAIEMPEGPQRIRGLAGSGKTVVLALKASYLHAQNPDWRIAVTFSSRALYQQIEDLVTRFSFEHSNDRFDGDRLQILHSWGSSGRVGMYSLMAKALDHPIRDFAFARGTYGYDSAFQGICRELLDAARLSPPEPLFDVVLIDEAQDLPPEFFQLVYLFTRAPKRIVWGYDELQKLSETAMPNTDELFGTGPAGESLISLDSGPDEARRDIVLPICYRNTPWALATAHALGIGVYRHGGLLQHPDEPRQWQDIGYNVLHGTLEFGQQVTLERDMKSTPEYFAGLLNADEAVVSRVFATQLEQDRWVAGEVQRNLSTDELQADDILIVVPDTYRTKSRAPKLMSALIRLGIDCHLVGVNNSVDEVFMPGSVAIAHIHRAKGNEAPMVYVVDAQYAAGDFNAVSRRNTLFTAITRSRAWVRICAHGDSGGVIAQEVHDVRENNFQLKFKIPTRTELAALRRTHRERSDSDEAAIMKARASIESFVEAFERDEVDLADLPPRLRTRLLNALADRDADANG